MRRNNLLARLFRALSGETQKGFARKTGVHFTLLADYELDKVEPSPENLEKLARGAGLTVEDGEQILRLAEALTQPRRRAGSGVDDLAKRLEALLSSTYEHLLRLPPLEGLPEMEDRRPAAEPPKM